MREIKFRVWDTGKSNDEGVPLMSYPMTLAALIRNDEIQFEKDMLMTDFSDFDWENEAVFLQFTGLYDKKGVEIYEGDILTDTLSTSLLIVEYRAPEYVGVIADDPDDYQRYFAPIDIIFESESKNNGLVIGNIYENPELIKESK